MKSFIIASIMLVSGTVLADEPFNVEWTLKQREETIPVGKEQYDFKVNNAVCQLTIAVKNYTPYRRLSEGRILSCMVGKKKFSEEVYCSRSQLTQDYVVVGGDNKELFTVSCKVN